MAGAEGLFAHLDTGITTVCRGWVIRRGDGEVFGFTDHDRDLHFGGVRFRADSGLTAHQLHQTTGLAVDNSEAVGALSDVAVTEQDLLAGRYDAAEVEGWLVDWSNVENRILQFRGTLGEITRSGGAFRAELRGLAEALNQPQGRSFHRGCAAILGDRTCRFDLGQPGYSIETSVQQTQGRRVFQFVGLPPFAERWFEKGCLSVVSGPAKGVTGVVKTDRLSNGVRMVELWQELGVAVEPGDVVRLEAGCDKMVGTCQNKFGNIYNFQGFPHIPGEDWLTAFPSSSGVNDGGSLLR